MGPAATFLTKSETGRGLPGGHPVIRSERRFRIRSRPATPGFRIANAETASARASSGRCRIQECVGSFVRRLRGTFRERAGNDVSHYRGAPNSGRDISIGLGSAHRLLLFPDVLPVQMIENTPDFRINYWSGAPTRSTVDSPCRNPVT